MKFLFIIFILNQIYNYDNYEEILNDSLLDQKSKEFLDLEIKNLEDIIRKIKLCIIGQAKEVNNYDSLIVTNAATNSTYINEIKEECVGDNYSILNRYYDELVYRMKFQLNYSLKKLLDSHAVCKQHTEECLLFFETIDIFMEKDFDLLKSVQNNRDYMEMNVGEYLYELFQKVIIQDVKSYKDIHFRLLNEKKVLIDMLENKFNEFVQQLSTKNMEKLNGIESEKLNIEDFFGMSVPNHDYYPITSLRQAPPEMPNYNRRLNEVKIEKNNFLDSKLESPLIDEIQNLKKISKKDLNRLLKQIDDTKLNQVIATKDTTQRRRLIKKK